MGLSQLVLAVSFPFFLGTRQGGSPHIALKINEAKEFLYSRARSDPNDVPRARKAPTPAPEPEKEEKKE